jgi:hypothetical protein
MASSANGSANGTRRPAGMEAYSLEALPGGVLHLGMNARLMRLEQARPLCGDIERASSGDAVRLVVDMGRLGLATPAAGLHGFRALRHVRIAAIAMVHTGPAMRRMATAMLRAARFPRFGFFDSREQAEAWLREEPGTEPAARTRGPVRRRLAAAAAAAGALAGGVVAARRCSRDRRARARRAPPGRSRRPRAR